MSGIIRVKHDKDRPYVTVSKTLTGDHRLSFRLRGMLVYLLGKPPGWQARASEITNAGEEGQAAIRATFAEGRKWGYITTEVRRGENGTFVFDHTIYESPVNPPIPEIQWADGTIYVPPNVSKGKTPDSPNPTIRVRLPVFGEPGSETGVLVTNESVSNEQASVRAGEQQQKPPVRTDDDAMRFFDSLTGYGFVARYRIHLARWYDDYSEAFLKLAWRLAPHVPNCRIPATGFIWLLNREKEWPAELKKLHARENAQPDLEWMPRAGAVVAFKGRAYTLLESDTEAGTAVIMAGTDEADSITVPLTALTEVDA